jgi:hypothetical protein
MQAKQQQTLFEDIFEVRSKDLDGKKFDKGETPLM